MMAGNFFILFFLPERLSLSRADIVWSPATSGCLGSLEAWWAGRYPLAILSCCLLASPEHSTGVRAERVEAPCWLYFEKATYNTKSPIILQSLPFSCPALCFHGNGASHQWQVNGCHGCVLFFVLFSMGRKHLDFTLSSLCQRVRHCHSKAPDETRSLGWSKERGMDPLLSQCHQALESIPLGGS